MSKPIDLGNLGGIWYFQSTPVAEFKFINDYLVRAVTYATWKDYCEEVVGKFNTWNIHEFFEEYIVPEERIDLLRDFARSTPIREYIPEQILRWNLCACTAHPCWVDVDNDTTCWKNLELYNKYMQECPTQRPIWTYPMKDREVL